MTPTAARDRAIRLATSDPEAALVAARSVRDPWFACLALAWVARFGSDGRVTAIADEAFDVGRQARDPFQAVGSAAWPLRALIERNCTSRAVTRAPEIVRMASNIENPASRSEALFLLFQSLFPAGIRTWIGVLTDLAQASDPAVHWRQSRNLRDAVLMAASEDLTIARDFCQKIQNRKVRTQIESRIANSQFGTPRPFFWTDDAEGVRDAR